MPNPLVYKHLQLFWTWEIWKSCSRTKRSDQNRETCVAE